MPLEPRELTPREQAAVLGLRLRHALDRIIPLAEAGNDRAQYRLGRRFTSWGDDAMAVMWYRLAAEQGNARAWLALARMEEWGADAGHHDEPAERASPRGADDLPGPGPAEHHDIESERHCSAPSPRPALLRSAELGYYEAQHDLGAWYAGEAIAASASPSPSAARESSRLWQEARRWYARAAEQGDARSQDDYGELILSEGEGASGDIQAGLAYLERAAASGHLPALRHLAHLYREGAAHVPADSAKALYWSDRHAHFEAESQARAARPRVVTWRSLTAEERELVESLPAARSTPLHRQ